jgi:hypothetical protein
MAPWPLLSTHAMPPGWFGSAATFAVASAVLLKSPPLDPVWSPPSKGRAAAHVYLSTHGIFLGNSPQNSWDLWMFIPPGTTMYKKMSAPFPYFDIRLIMSYHMCWQQPASFIAYKMLTPFWLVLSPTVVT